MTTNPSGVPHDDDYDPELDDILNDALNDFNTVPNPTPNVNQQQKSNDDDVVVEREDDKEGNPVNNQSDEEMQKMLEELKKNFDGLLGDGLGNDEFEKFMEGLSEEEKKTFSALSKDMEKLFQFDLDEKDVAPEEKTTSQSNTSGSGNNHKDLDDIITETLSMLNKEPETWKSESLTENKEEKKDIDPDAILNDMLKLFSGASGASGASSDNQSTEDGEKDDEKMFGILENMMQSFLAPDILLEPMEKLVEQYPKWLEEKKGKIEEESYRKVENQYKYAKEICQVYHTKDYPGCLEEIITLMTQMQENGQPPEEIVNEITKDGGEMPSFPPLPGNPNNPEQCSIQ